MNHQIPFPPVSQSETNEYRIQLAQMLARNCPPTLAESLAITGSTARGLGDAASDLEVNFWVTTLPGHDERLDWLVSMGLRDPVVHFRPRADQSVWINGQFHGVALEAGWQTFAALDASLTPILAGEVFQRKVLTLAELITSALLLRDNGQIAAWQTRLKEEYPAALRAQLYEDALKRLNDPERLADARRLAQRGEVLALVDMLRDDITLMMRLLYALNGRWEAGQKWTLTLADGLPIMPQNWRARIHEIFAAPLDTAVDLCHALLAEAINLYVEQGY